MDFYLFLGTVAATIFTLLVSIFYMVYGKFRVQESKIIASPPSPPSSPSLLCQSPIMASSSLSLSPLSSSPRNWIHDVFPSFHGADVRKAFLSHILKEFRSKGIYPFIDNEIKRGESIGPELIRAIRGSRIGIVLLSKNYASSSWCLKELVEIMKSRTELGQKVMVVFYEVDPTDVKKQTGDFGKAFKETCQGKTEEEIETWRQALEGLATIAEDFGKGFNESCQGKTEEEIETWRQALADVATIAGYHSSNWGTETAMIEKIATDVSDMLNNFTQSRDNDRLVGMEAHTERLKPLLRLDLEDEVRMIGIWGPPGIGKSTLARFLFNQLSRNFQLTAIMVNIKGGYPSPCLDEGSAKLQLQSQMLSNMINHKDIMIKHLGVAQERLKDRKVLLVLDDVDQLAQLDALARENRWFGPGSRIIISTEDRRVLDAHGMINHIYQVDYPSTDEAFQIFCMNAFLQKHPYNGFYELAQQVTQLAGNLPLGLEVLGSALRGMSKQEWKMALPGLKTRLDGKIESIFKFSYDALCDEDKDLFLYIACFFNDLTPVNRAEELLGKKFSDVRQRLRVLAEKSLISIEADLIDMHTLLIQFGRETSRKQFLHGPAKRQILVYSEDICEVLSDDTTDGWRVIGINLDLAKIDEEMDISEKALERMSNLQFVRIYGNDLVNPDSLQSLQGLIDHCKKIRSLHWMHFQNTCLPTNFNPKFLVNLVMLDSKLQTLWIGAKPLRNLKWMNLRSSKDLKELPDLSTATNLEYLILENCSSLMELPSSIGKLTKLQMLDLSGCSSLLELPSFTENVTGLQILDLSGCSSLRELPSSIGNAINLQKLFLKGCSSLVELPSSIRNFTDLEELNLSNCSSLVKLPSIGNATNLQKLDLSNCSNLVDHSSIGNFTDLEELNLSNCSSLVKLPSIGNATNLQKLDLSNCSNLVDLSSIGNATNLRWLNLSNCSSLVKLPSTVNATNLQILELTNYSSLEELPPLIGTATDLNIFDLSRCSSLVKLPSSIGNITYLLELNLDNCSNLVELPSSIGNLHLLSTLSLICCRKLQKLPIDINLESLYRLDLTNCSMLKSFPEISTNIKYLSLVGTAIEEVPSSIKSWPHLSDLGMSYFENLKNFPHVLDIITELYLSEDIQEVPSLVKGIPRLCILILGGCNKLVSLPQLQDSLYYLHARDCKSLERLDCSFHNPDICLDFANCFNLNQNARDLIMHTSTSAHAILPGTEVPAYFNYRATAGGSLTIKLNQRPLPTSMRFKACILLVKGNDETGDNEGSMMIYTHIMEKQNYLTVTDTASFKSIYPVLTNHLYTFDVEVEVEVEAKEVTSSELVFDFKTESDKWKIGEYGVFQIFEVPSC